MSGENMRDEPFDGKNIGGLDLPTVERLADRPIALSFFSGAMGLDMGLEAAGFFVRLASEIDKDARATINRNRPGIPLIGDIRDYTAAQVRAAAGIGDSDIDLVVGGTPCQPWSIDGNQAGFDDPRGKAFLTFIDLATELNPRYIVIENVPGLLSANEGCSMEAIRKMLQDGGYAVSFNVYNTAYFGAPQKRERLVIIASRNGRVPHLTPTHSNRPGDGLPPWQTLRDAIGDLKGIEHHGAVYEEERLKLWRLLKPGQNGRDLRGILQARGEDVASVGKKSCYYNRFAWDEPTPTLVTKPGSFRSGCCHPEEHRPLSIEECKRVQCFPDECELCGCITSQYRQIGNAVPVSFGAAIGRAILEHMRTRNSDDPVPGFRYSRSTGMSDLDWRARGRTETAEVRLAKLGPAIRLANEKTERSLLVAIQNVLPQVRKGGRLLMKAKGLCKKCDIRWQSWVPGNCGMSVRSAQAYMRIARNWESLPEAQTSAPLSIKGALDWLAQPKEEPETAKGTDDCPSSAGADTQREHAQDTVVSPAVTVEREAEVVNAAMPAGTTASGKPASGGGPQDITPERRRELEDALKHLFRRRDQLTRDIVPLVAQLVSRLAGDIQVAEWDKRDRRYLSEVADGMAASLASIRDSLAVRQPCRRHTQRTAARSDGSSS